jgi:UDP-N-acetylmuramyl pentapeptide phosphotransferase/UDP-N-acetylglucosamine-1-phosphate transferase
MSEVVNGYSGALIATISALAAFAAAHLLARVVTRSGYLLDQPNQRSSHVTATPRSGGAAIVGGWTVGMILVAGFAGWSGFADKTIALVPLVVGAFLFGLADDRHNLRPRAKLGLQILIAVLFVAAFGPLKSAPLPFLDAVDLGPIGALVAVVWIVGFMNAFNFMDGVNGIAAACGALALAALAAAAAFLGAPLWAVSSGIGAVALLSFLPMNFPHARLFMGDNGSQAAGFLIAASAVGAANDSGGAVSALFVPTLMLPFLFDVAFTLAHRARRGCNVLAAHREHLYQLLLRLGLSHVGVTSIYLTLTALCAAAALLLLRAPAPGQWFVPAVLAALLAGPAYAVFARARRAGLLPRAGGAVAGESAPAGPDEVVATPQAAE